MPTLTFGLRLQSLISHTQFLVLVLGLMIFQVTGSTCELVARRGDAIYKKAKAVKDEGKKKELLKNAITHLILDEASQLPPHLALALYVMLPSLKQVTLIGETRIW